MKRQYPDDAIAEIAVDEPAPEPDWEEELWFAEREELGLTGHYD
jgi:hypothetical protein